MREVQTITNRYDHPGCIALIQKGIGTCHNSCCGGEMAYCEEHNQSHTAQGSMDLAGYPNGYFGDLHSNAVKMVILICMDLSEVLKMSPCSSVWLERLPSKQNVHSSNLCAGSNSEKMIRAGGDVICDTCGKKYYDHPMDKKQLSFDDRPFLHIRCDGVRLKL